MSRFNPESPACRKGALSPKPSQDEYVDRTLEIICCRHHSLESYCVVSWEEPGLRGRPALDSVLTWLLVSCDPKQVTSSLSLSFLICNSNRNLLCRVYG